MPWVEGRWLGGWAGGCGWVFGYTDWKFRVCVCGLFFGEIGMQEVDGSMWTSGDERGVDEVMWWVKKRRVSKWVDEGTG